MKSTTRTALAVTAAMVAVSATLLATPGATAKPARTSSEKFAPVDRPGPKLSVPRGRLAKSVQCTSNANRARRGVVLFVPGTTLTPRENFGWNWFPALAKRGRPYCSVTMPNNAMSDIQVSAEYVVSAIRHVHRISGRKVDVVGFSQGGNVPRFALRFWPDTRRMVDDYVALAATNHGSLVVNAMCPPVVGCAPALWQQTFDSNYVRAMNSRQETFPGISYTAIYTRTDQFVQPNLDDTGTTSLHGGGGKITNVAVQDVCPAGPPADHLAVGSHDPTAYALTVDALTHAGPAKPARAARSACTEPLMPGVDPVKFPGDYASMLNTITAELATYPRTESEPPLKRYVYAN